MGEGEEVKRFEEMEPREDGVISLEREACAYILEHESLHQDFEQAETDEEKENLWYSIQKNRQEAWFPFIQLLKKSGVLDDEIARYRQELAEQEDD